MTDTNLAAIILILILLGIMVYETKQEEPIKELELNITIQNQEDLIEEPITGEYIKEEPLNCEQSCISLGYIEGRGPFETSENCHIPEIPSEGVCCCLHEEFAS